VSDIFEYIRAHPNQEFLLRASYMEIYNESLKDLLAPETQGLVKIRQDEQKRFFVSPLREEVVTSEAQVAALLLRGEANRHTGSTDYNARSSRSHTVFQMVRSLCGAGRS
jgi:centromeric protein E